EWHQCLTYIFSSRRRHTRSKRDWSSDVCSSDLGNAPVLYIVQVHVEGGLVELDDVDAVLVQRTRFLVQELGKCHGELHLVAVVRSEERRVGKECKCVGSME